MRAPLDRYAVTLQCARRVICILTAVMFAAAALSCASMRPATRARVVHPPVIVEPLPPDADTYGMLPPSPIAPSDAATIDEAPLSDAIAVPQPPPAGGRIPAPPTSNLIALILPLDEPAFSRAAGAVRDGFLDAAAAAGKSGQCIVLAHGSGNVVAAFDAARAKGVRVAVGPLVRDDLKALALADVELPWTLALNRLDDGTPLPPAIYSFSLSVEGDGRMLAQRARALGAQSIDVLEGDSPLMKRLATSFALAWTRGGGQPPAALHFDPTPETLTGLRGALSRQPPSAALLAVTGEHAALVKPFIGDVVAYASGLVFERPTPAVARDLDGVRVAEIPWLLTPDAPQFSTIQRREFDSDALARLYAFGRDAFAIAASFTDGPPDRFERDGATGHITLVPGQQFRREGMLGVYRDGVLVPFEATP